MRRTIWQQIIILVASLSFLLSPHLTTAQDTLEEGGLAISPFLFKETINPGQTIEKKITIFNYRDTSLPLSVSINDFEPVGKNGQVRFLAPDQTTSAESSLASWITIKQQPEFNIAAKQTTDLVFTITAPNDAGAGAHYGGLLFSYQTQADKNSNSLVVKKIAAVIMVQIGTAKPNGELIAFSSSKNRYTEPNIEFTTVFKNTGNTYLEPKGKIEIKNIFGKVVGLSYSNKDANTILPNTERIFISDYKDTWMFGRYTATTILYYGNPKLEARAETIFWVLPTKMIIQTTIWTLLIIMGGYFTIKLYNHWIIKRSEN